MSGNENPPNSARGCLGVGGAGEAAGDAAGDTSDFKQWAEFYFIFSSSPEDFFFIAFRERGRERERDQCEREALIGCLPHGPGLGIEPTTLQLRDELKQPTEPHRPGLKLYTLSIDVSYFFLYALLIC